MATLSAEKPSAEAQAAELEQSAKRMRRLNELEQMDAVQEQMEELKQMKAWQLQLVGWLVVCLVHALVVMVPSWGKSTPSI